MDHNATTSETKTTSTVVPSGALPAPKASKAAARRRLLAGPRAEKTVALALQGGGALDVSTLT